NYRIASSKPGSPEQLRMIKEADFAFRQALAFCPYSPEAVYRYVNLLLSMQRFDDALQVANICLKLDPHNSQMRGLKNSLEGNRTHPAQGMVAPSNLAQMQKTVQDNPKDVQAAFNLAAFYLQMGQTNSAIEVLDRVLANTQDQPAAVLAIAQ